jgi:hypothetical protein
VNQAEVRGVQRDARHGDGVLLLAAVDRVSEHGVTEVGEVHPHLVRASRAELGADEGHAAETLERRDDGARGPSAGAGRQRGAAGAGAGAADAPLDLHLAGEVAGHQRLVAPRHRVGAELALQVLGGRMSARQHHHPGGVSVETVHDVDAPRVAATPRELDHQACEHRVLLAGHGGVDEQSGGLVDHHDVVVEVEHRNARARRLRRPARKLRLVSDRVAGADPVAGVGDDLPADRDMPDQHLALGAREGAAEQLLQPPREPCPPAVLLHTSTLPSPRSVCRC